MNIRARLSIVPALLGTTVLLGACVPLEPAPEYPVYEGPVYYDQYGYPVAPPPGYYGPNGYYGSTTYYDYPSYYYTDPAYSGYFYFDNGVRRPYPDHRWHGNSGPPPPRYDNHDGGGDGGYRGPYRGDGGDRHHGDGRPPVNQPPPRGPRDVVPTPQSPRRPFPNQNGAPGGGIFNGGGPGQGPRPNIGQPPQAMPRPMPSQQPPMNRPAPQPQSRGPANGIRNPLER